jgi:DNA-binding Xre family transcriptional regulator
MPALKNRLLELIHQKETLLGRRLSQAEIARETGLPENTVSRWVNTGIVKRVEHSVVLELCKYFQCELGELIYIDWKEPDV